MDVPGDTIRRIRQALRLSQHEFALWFGVRDQAVRRWETGQRRMLWSHQQRLVHLLQQDWVQRRLREAGVVLTGLEARAR